MRRHTLAVFSQGMHDPTIAFDGADLWRATVTPHGTATLHIAGVFGEDPRVRTYGDGAGWLTERALDILGGQDRVPEIEPRHDAVHEARRRFGALALGASHTVYHELLPAVLGQRITGLEAHRQWRALLRAHGQQAPGPRDGLLCPPDPARLSEIPYHALHGLGIERKRADTLRHVAARFDYLSRLTADDAEPHDKTQRLTVIPGVGVWTSAVAGGLAFGDPDALLVGDFHVKNTVAYALTGAIRGTDEEMIATMAPYAGQRHRVVRWLQLAGWRAPARGPRRRIVSIARF